MSKVSKVKKESPVAETCNICVETFNKSSRKPVICEHCEYKTCSSCCQSYLLTINTPKCMNCNSAWLRESLQKKLPKSFLDTELKTHHKKYLFDIETSLLPATMPEVEKYKTLREIKNKISEIQKRINKLKKDKRSSEGIMIIQNLQEEINMLKIMETTTENGEIRVSTRKNSSNTIVKRCPSNNCRAFLDSDFKCTLCNISVCKECHQTISEGHECKKDDIETVKFIKNSAKHCPSCTVPIYKIEGCDQMWCVNCHTAFSWETGNIDNSKIHNPHYFRWLAATDKGRVTRNPLDFTCGRDLGEEFLVNYIKIQDMITCKYNNPYVTTYYDNVYYFRFIINNMLTYLIPQYQENRQSKNLQSRIKYILNEIDEDEFKTELFSNEKMTLRNKEILDLITMYIHVCTDIFYKIYDNAYSVVYKNVEIDFTYMQEFIKLTEYFKTQLEHICSVYNTKTPSNVNFHIGNAEKNLKL